MRGGTSPSAYPTAPGPGLLAVATAPDPSDPQSGRRCGHGPRWQMPAACQVLRSVWRVSRAQAGHVVSFADAGVPGPVIGSMVSACQFPDHRPNRRHIRRAVVFPNRADCPAGSCLDPVSPGDLLVEMATDVGAPPFKTTSIPSVHGPLPAGT